MSNSQDPKWDNLPEEVQLAATVFAQALIDWGRSEMAQKNEKKDCPIAKPIKVVDWVWHIDEQHEVHFKFDLNKLYVSTEINRPLPKHMNEVVAYLQEFQ